MDLHSFSLTNRSAFWGQVLSSANFISSGSCARVVDESLPIDAVPRWFEGVHLNFAENMLYSSSSSAGRKGGQGKEDGKVAVVEVREGASETREVTYGELRERAGRLARAMKENGVEKGDRIVIVGANSVETLLVLLASTWVGAVFSSSSTDMGVKGVLQRAVQVNPKVSDTFLERGKRKVVEMLI